ncbi:hypothetical protein GIB67_035063 [Kingdonia uniflora]|uniref:60S ribosomal export protein NMD3 n=1 Tax=Kingdonia uniflora TaxID=39325 RepID=A0A7J7L1T9_9MAGN|nr:hypothetical protein GIB67_035063 [Kingdonia uniflora]
MFSSSTPTAMETDTGMFRVQQTVGGVLCCKCGILMAPNAANMCVTCLRSEVDITEGLQKFLTIQHCPECDRYLQPPRTWIPCQLESRELLTFCIKRLNLSNKVRLADAEFIWTEPHSKRIKVKVKVRKEVLNGVILEQGYVAEYVSQDHMCEVCSRVAANPDQWVAAVQLRQHVGHRRTFFYLEQLIIKHDAAVKATKIKQMEHGIDFFFANRSHGLKFVEFVGKVVPVKSRSDKQLVSHDTKSQTYNYKHTFSVEICEICREDLICLPPKVANSLGNLGPLVLCTKVSNNIILVDPFTLRHAFLDADQYWRVPFKALISCRQLIPYIVLDVDPVASEVSIAGSKYALADVQIARVSDFGKNDIIMTVRTHLGHLLNPGDTALGYDLYGANTNDIDLDKYKGLSLPDAILVKKSYEQVRLAKCGKPRKWDLKKLPIEVDETTRGRSDEDKGATEYEKFLKDLEENPDLTLGIKLCLNKDYQSSGVASDIEEELPIDEHLAKLVLNDSADAGSMDE